MHNTNPPCTHLGQGLLGRVLWLAEQLFNHAAGLCHSRSQVLVRVGPHGLDEGPLHGGLGLKQLHFLVQGQVIERRVHGVNAEEWHAWVENKQAVVVPAALIRKIRWGKKCSRRKKKGIDSFFASFTRQGLRFSMQSKFNSCQAYSTLYYFFTCVKVCVPLLIPRNNNYYYFFFYYYYDYYYCYTK